MDVGQWMAAAFIGGLGILLLLWARSGSRQGTDALRLTSMRAGQASARYLDGVELNPTIQQFWTAVEAVTGKPVPNLVRWKVDASFGLGDVIQDPTNPIGRIPGLARSAAREALRIMENEDWNASTWVSESLRELEGQMKTSG